MSSEREQSNEISVVLSPAQLAEYAVLDRDLPALVIQAGQQARRQEFIYATLGMCLGFSAFLAVILLFAFLVLHDYPKSAAALLTAGVLGIAGSLIAQRLIQQGSKKQPPARRTPKVKQAP